MATFDAGTPATRYAQARAEGVQRGFYGDNADAYVRDNYPEIFAGMGDNVPDLSIAKNPELLAPIEQAQAQTQAQTQAQAQTSPSVEEGINQSYLDEFKRPASQDEINFYVKEFGADNVYDAGEKVALENRLAASVGDTTVTDDQVQAQTGIASVPIPAGQVIDLFQKELGRDPNEEEIKYYQDLYGGALSPFERRQFQSSPEAVRYRSTTEGGLRGLYEDVLNRPPTGEELEFYKRDANYGEFLDPQEVNRFIRAARFGDPTTGQEGEIITSLRSNLGIPTLDFSRFGAAPVTTGEGATAGIERLRPTDTTGTMIGAFESPQLKAQTEILQRAPFDPTAERSRIGALADVGPTLFPTFQDIIREDVRQSDEAEEGKRSGGIARLYKEGGGVGDKGLANVAQKMAAYGRYGDTMLAHISPEEAMILTAMGGSGTRNPVTGLPEFFLKKLFRSVKSIVKPIFKIGKKILPVVVAASNPALGASLAAADAGFKDGKFDFKDAGLAAIKTLALAKAGEAIAAPPEAAGGVNVGVKTVDPSTFPYGVKEATMSTAAVPTAPTIGQQLTEPFTDPIGFAEGVRDTGARIGSGVIDRGGEILGGDFSGLEGTAVPLSVAGLTTTAEMGLDEAQKVRNKQKAVIAAREEKKKKYRDLASRLGQQFPFGYAEGGISSLPPRYLDGMGDGMSDSIKANIEGMQEARLADGEFVVPADVVADLGNGSSNAGAERLYSMMDRIREARHGTTKQPPEINVNKVLPA
jgi:hypothetical protein